jgi:hypothetical protein
MGLKTSIHGITCIEIQSTLREDYPGQVTIQCSEDSPATGQHQRNDKQWIGGRIRKFNRRNERSVQHDNETKMHHQYPSTERVYSEFIWQIFTGGLFLYESFSSLEQTRRILISWKARGVKWWTGNEAETMGQLLTCSVASLSCQRRLSWETKMKTCFSQLWFHGLASSKSVHKISDQLWFADRSRLYLILNKNWRVHFSDQTSNFDVF